LARPFAFPCYTSYNGTAKRANTTACAEIELNKMDLSYLGGHFGGLTQGNWGVCQATNKGCPISPTKKSERNIIEGNCDQGTIPDYYIDVREVSDVEKGLKFANKHEIQVVIKNTGHDYTGRSAAPHALALWTHNVQPPITLAIDFVPEGCNNPTGNAVTFGAGQTWDGIYKFAEAHNVTVVGGSSATVGAAGGWITGGGHSALSPVFGLGVDNVQQLRVVLPNGTFVTANHCQNKDIFFAFRGGGGGTFGVVMEMSTLAHPQVTVQWANFQFPNLTDTQSRQYLQVLVSNANRWAAEGWGGYSYPLRSHDLAFVNPLLSGADAAASLKPLYDFARSLTDPTNITLTAYPSWGQLYAAHIADTLALSGNRGAALSSRLVPSANFDGDQNQHRLVEALAASPHPTGPAVALMLLMVAPWRTPDVDSAVTPVWRRATWHVIMLTAWDPAETSREATNAAFRAVHEAINPLRELTPAGGAYLNEADTFERDPVGSFWGWGNYERLVGIKREVDPKGVLQVHQGVGWDPKAGIFGCYPEDPNGVAGERGGLLVQGGL